MARRSTTTPSGPSGRGSAGRGRGGTGNGGSGDGRADEDAEFEENIVDIDVTEEMRGSYLEYAYSVIYQRALPDARDGLKPVQRRILYQMSQMGLRPDRAHVKCARVVGEVMGRLHPHGDSAIYDALVRLHQPWSMRLPLVDGHGNFGSPDDSPAAMRYTEARMAAAATEMTNSLDEDTVDFIPNYDGTETQPEVLPAAFPNLLVNGASGIAVGMATNMAPHNLGEVIAAARHLIANPDADLETLMRYVPGPDLPTGGKIVGLDGIREAYESGRGIFRTRAAARIEKITPRRMGIVVTELPYGVGPERVMARIKDLVQTRKLNGVSDLKDLTDMNNGLQLVIEVRSGFVPEAVLDELYRLTPMEETFGINNVALVNGQPRVLGLRDMLQIYVDFRIDVVRRRCEFRRAKREARQHLVDGLLIALLNIDEVIQVIRTSDDAAAAKERLMSVFDLSDIQAQYILDTPLRRLTRYDKLELERERETLATEIAELTAILDSEQRLRELVSSELAAVSEKFATPRRTVLLEGTGAAPRAASVSLEVADEPCTVLLSSAGLLARTAAQLPASTQDTLPVDDNDGERGSPRSRRKSGSGGPGQRAAHDVIVSSVSSTARGTVGVLTSARADPARRAGTTGAAAERALPCFVRRRAGQRVHHHPAGRDHRRLGRGRRSRCRARARNCPGRGEARHARLPAKLCGIRRHRAERRRPGSRRRATGRRRRRAHVHHQRRPAAAIPGVLGAAPGPVGCRHGGHQTVAAGKRHLVRRSGSGSWRAGCRVGRPRVRAGRGDGGRSRWRSARDRGRKRQGHSVCRVPAEGARHRRSALPPVPQGRRCPRPGLGRAGSGARRD